MGKDKVWLTVLIVIGLVAGTAVGQLLHGGYDEGELLHRISEARARLKVDRQARESLELAERIRAETAQAPTTTAPEGLLGDAERAALEKIAAVAPADVWTLHEHGGALRYFRFIGRNIFMNALFMLIIPLVLTSVISGVTSVGDFRKLGRIGGMTLVYYFSTMLIAVTIGLVLVYTIRPGDRFADSTGGKEAMQARAQASYVESGKEATVARNKPEGLGGALLNILEQVIPSNVMESMVGNQPLPVIFFAILFGIMLTTLGQPAHVVIQFFDGAFLVMMRLVHVVIWLAPVGVFCLLAWTVARIGLGTFTDSIGRYMLTVIVGLALHGLIVLPLVLWLFARVNPFVFMHRMKQALMTAFGTDSSSATLPVTMECATEFGGVSKKAAGFVLPLGATINMDGTALYEAVAVAFLAQCYGVEVGMIGMVVIALTATLAAVGAAGIPEAGLVTMAIVVTAVNSSVLEARPDVAVIPLAGIGLILGVDRILDMCRTTVNVWGDAVGAKIITQYEPDPAPAAT